MEYWHLVHIHMYILTSTYSTCVLTAVCRSADMEVPYLKFPPPQNRDLSLNGGPRKEPAISPVWSGKSWKAARSSFAIHRANFCREPLTSPEPPVIGPRARQMWAKARETREGLKVCVTASSVDSIVRVGWCVCANTFFYLHMVSFSPHIYHGSIVLFHYFLACLWKSARKSGSDWWWLAFEFVVYNVQNIYATFMQKLTKWFSRCT